MTTFKSKINIIIFLWMKLPPTYCRGTCRSALFLVENDPLLTPTTQPPTHTLGYDQNTFSRSQNRNRIFPPSIRFFQPEPEFVTANPVPVELEPDFSESNPVPARTGFPGLTGIPARTGILQIQFLQESELQKMKKRIYWLTWEYLFKA